VSGLRLRELADGRVVGRAAVPAAVQRDAADRQPGLGGDAGLGTGSSDRGLLNMRAAWHDPND